MDFEPKEVMEMHTAAFRQGDTCTINGCQWMWVPEMWSSETDVVFGHWLATDGSKIQVFPPQQEGGIWLVVVPTGNREILVQLEESETAFCHASRSRLSRRVS